MLVYPIILTQYDDNTGYMVEIPDLDIYTEGKNIGNAIEMARDAIGINLIQLQDEGKEFPIPSSMKIDVEDNEIVTLVDIDVDKYRLMHDNRTVKKNCTIPYYLNVEAEKRGLNFSRLLQEAILQKISS